MLHRQYCVRIAVFLALVVLTVFTLGMVYQTVNTLRRLEVVEAERDRWQRPGEVLGALDLRAGNTAVDLGCGAGYFALKLSHAVGDRGRVVAIDIRRVPLLFLQLRALLEGRHNLTVARTQPDDPGLAAGTVDAVLIANTFHELGSPGSILRHVIRALRPRGRLVVADPSPHGAEEHGERHLEPAAVEDELRRSGFEIVLRNDRFVERSDGTAWWLIVARKPDLHRS
jgi:ubiquinone/menaquinone biosynthesis C-methylase UbiE